MDKLVWKKKNVELGLAEIDIFNEKRKNYQEKFNQNVK